MEVAVTTWFSILEIPSNFCAPAEDGAGDEDDEVETSRRRDLSLRQSWTGAGGRASPRRRCERNLARLRPRWTTSRAPRASVSPPDDLAAQHPVPDLAIAQVDNGERRSLGTSPKTEIRRETFTKFSISVGSVFDPSVRFFFFVFSLHREYRSRIGGPSAGTPARSFYQERERQAD